MASLRGKTKTFSICHFFATFQMLQSLVFSFLGKENTKIWVFQNLSVTREFVLSKKNQQFVSMFRSFAHQDKMFSTFDCFRKQSISKLSRLININKICYFCEFLRKGNTSLQAILLEHVLKNKNRKRFLQQDFEEKCCFLQKSEKVAKK